MLAEQSDPLFEPASLLMKTPDTGRTKLSRERDSILYGCESHGQGTQRSVQAWLDQTTSCMVKAENVEKPPRHGVLGRYTACST